jgi:KDO2-lipid IV(A) lauroyltransferase
MFALFRLLSHCPLWLLHALGVVLGWWAFGASAVYRQRFLANAARAGYSFAQVRGAVAQAGCMVAELPRLWLGALPPVRWDGAELIERAHAAGQGLVFLTPHLGCFEIAAQAYAADFGGAGAHPITVLYRPARRADLRDLLRTARQRPDLATAPTTLAGVKQLLKALRAGQAVGLLPDQTPPEGLGVWSPFFGQEAYTMTLSVRLAKQSGATVVLAWGERLSWGRGYIIHLRALQAPLDADLMRATAQINVEMERLIRECPQQYLWGYARYKQPRRDS